VLLVVVALVAGAAFWVHRTVVPLDLLGYEAQSRVEKWLIATFPGVGGPARGE
jgi:hypothetical protein